MTAKPLRAFVLVLVLLSLSTLTLRAQVAEPGTKPAEGTPKQEEKGVLTWDTPARILHYEDRPGRLYMLGDVETELDGRYLRCDNLIAWVRKGDQRRPPGNAPGIIKGTGEKARKAADFITELYAEGFVVYVDKKGETIFCDRLFLDVAHERGIAIDATLSAPLQTRDGKSDLVVKAAELRILAGNRIQGSGVKVWVGRFGRPFTHVTSDRMEFVKRPPSAIDPDDPNRRSSYRIDAQGNVLRAGQLPVMWLPDFTWDSEVQHGFGLIESIRARHSSEFGYEAGVSIGDDIQFEEGRRWGHWSVHADWYSKRGPGVGVDLVYDDDDYRGLLYTRYQYDEGEDENFGRPPTRNRGRVSWWHRHQLPEGVQLDLELQLFSDRGYYPTYFEDQEKGLKPPENLVYLKKVFFNSMVSGLASARINDWFTRVEHQPELRYDLVTEPLFDLFDHPLYLSVEARGGHARLIPDERLVLEDRDSWRIDVDTLLEYAFPVGPFKLTPFAGLRYTYYEEDLIRRTDRDRVGFTSGATVSLQAWRVWDTDGGLFNLDGLRHVIIPEITFRNTTGIAARPMQLIPFDEVETFDNLQAFELRLRNLLQTVRQREDGPEVDTFVDLELEIPYFPNPRDNFGNPWGNLDVDLLVRFSDDLQLVTDLEFNWYGRDFEVANVAVGYTPSRELQAYAGYRHFDGEYDAVFFQINHRIDEKWMITLETSYDIKEDRGIDQRVAFTRIGPEWVAQLGLRIDAGENDFGIFISLEPRWLFDPILRPGLVSGEPRLNYLGSGFGQ
ncbi:MAG: hypothetical protein CMJ83_17395 [Planctomycetes bacterium]|nr:hypothetical protein [Planctomycetota bacterium]